MNKNKLEMSMSLEHKLTHTLSMKIMEIGQIIFEIEEDYKHSLSRRAFEKIKRAKELLYEVANEHMTPITAERMKNWKQERNQERELNRKFSRTPDPWEMWTQEQKQKFSDEVTRKCIQGFGGGQV